MLYKLPASRLRILKIALPVAALLSIVFISQVAVSASSVWILGFACLLIVAVCMTQSRSNILASSTNGFYLTITIWWFLLVSEVAFVRSNTLEDLLDGQYAVTAYGDVAIWILSLLILMSQILAKPAALRAFLRSQAGRYILVFAAIALISSFYSPDKVYSLAWSFKLCLIAVLVLLLHFEVRSFQHIKMFILATLTAYIVITLTPLLQLGFDPDSLFKAFRLGGRFAPTGVSAAGAIVFLLSLVHYATSRRKQIWLVAAIGLLMAMLGGGKAAIAALTLAGLAFFILQGKVGASLGLLGLIAVVGGLTLLASPVAQYAQMYQDNEYVTSLTGRTHLWQVAIPAILEQPLLGHGYVSSKFVYFTVDNVWWKAGHLHNSVLDVLYNNGVIGLLPIIAMIGITARNLLKVKRQSGNQLIIATATGMLSLLIFLLANGMFTTYFGGRPHNGFMIFLALVALSEKLRGMTSVQKSANAAAALEQHEVKVVTVPQAQTLAAQPDNALPWA